MIQLLPPAKMPLRVFFSQPCARWNVVWVVRYQVGMGACINRWQDWQNIKNLVESPPA